MLERSALAGNALRALHEEDYFRPFETCDLNAETLIHTRGRQALPLDGAWNFCVDLLDTGLRQRWYAMEPASPEERDLPWDYDPYVGETVPVPSCWQMLREKWYFFEGSVWYTRPLDLTPVPGRRYILRIGAAQYDCKLFVNGSFVGNHAGGSTPFCADLTGHLRPGRNWLMLCVNNTRTLDRVPMRNSDWFNYGGIYREVALYDLPEAFLRSMFVHLVADGNNRRIRIVVEAEGLSCATVEIPELGVSGEIAVDGGRGEIILEAALELWSPENPRLYDVILRGGDDEIRDRVGFRTVVVRGHEILLNGRPVWLRGIAVHEDDMLTGKCTSEEDLRRRFLHARELGCNFLRLAHYPHHERAAELADELGFLLWEEIPVYWAIDFANPRTFEDARNQLTELIRRDRNRASVIFWSVGNENADTDARLAFMTALASTARDEDGTRLITAACLVNHAACRIEDRLVDCLDVIGINEYYGWYENDFADLAAIGRNSEPGKPVLISETGADADISDCGPERGLFSESYQAEVYRRQLEILRAIPWVQGMSPWILYDFRVERRQNVFQRGYNRKGLIAADKATKKEAFRVLSEFYEEVARMEEVRL
ncbi:glycoside hydrolase family 2 protein [Oricola cellulosilytica]|uniref:Glycoside hydrolase family 2 n=1 Tax=Oricola cellulosilytica TaxID=1429082 RepID=A0A4R0P8H5_9HYPH|nr:glycoside hydrolase family 2 TIM barrel-domain containing protein [Oricola cellulosilytica]TCD13362.1 glycoside hydrolase family 2 [Oricola cellulosilytica]